MTKLLSAVILAVFTSMSAGSFAAAHTGAAPAVDKKTDAKPGKAKKAKRAKKAKKGDAGTMAK